MRTFPPGSGRFPPWVLSIGMLEHSHLGEATKMKASSRVEIKGHVSEGFEAVRDVFAENFSRRGELGAAFCVYYRGEKVVDLWGGVRNKETGEPWEEDTMALVHSTTKGAAGLAMALASTVCR